MHRLNRHLLLSVLLLISHASYSQSVDWPLLTFTQITTNTFNLPIRLTHAGDGSGRLFVLERGGKIWIVQSNNVLPQPFLDLSSRADIFQMIGMAFPPGFATNNHFFV